MHQTLWRWFVLANVLLLGPATWAAGVSDNEILIGQTAGFTGPAAASVKESTAGARLYFDWINAQGGVYGRRIVLESRDDKFDPKLAAENVRRMIAERPPIAFILSRGTPHTQAMLPYTSAAKIPIVAPGTAAAIFHTPTNPLVFNLRASNQLEVEKAIEHLHTVGINQIALAHVDDAFGQDIRTGFDRAMGQLNLKPVLIAKFDRAKFDVSATVQAIVEADPQATIVAGSLTHVATIMAQVRKAGGTTQLLTLSFNAVRGFVELLGEQGRGVIVAQAFPNPMSTSPLAREMRRLANSHREFVYSHQAMEGFTAAKLMVEGLRRAGKRPPTSESLVAALNGMRDVDLGGFAITYSPADHGGGKFVELSIIDARGEFLQ